jgi:CubicO group peptidase (beta-lactamase class C family)
MPASVQECEEEMSILERTIQIIENCLLVETTDLTHPFEKHGLLARMKHHKVPGVSIALIDWCELVWAKGYGVVEAGTKEAVTPETIFQAASISKPVTAMVALHLVEAGLLDLDADVNDTLRSWKVPDNPYTQEHNVTLRGLLSHTAGITVPGYLGYPADAELPTLVQILNGISPAASKPVRVGQVPGRRFEYSGGGYVIVQQLIEDASNQSLSDLAQELIFDPLEMRSSTFESRLPEAYLPRAATAHRVDGTPVPGRWHIYPEGAPASLWSTPSDLVRLVVEVLESLKDRSNKVLTAEMTRQMLTPQVSWVGLGFPLINIDGRVRFEHPGWNEGFHSLMVCTLDTGQGLVFMTNGENGKNLGRELMLAIPDYGWTGW